MCDPLPIIQTTIIYFHSYYNTDSLVIYLLLLTQVSLILNKGRVIPSHVKYRFQLQLKV